MEPDYENLYKWIEEHSISRPKRNINRDFSDAMPLVEILKQHYPKLVELHNYSSRNSYAQKLINWDTLNVKVLKKLKINLGKKRIEQLAKGEPGFIEKLLLEVKKTVDTKPASSENCEIYYLEGSNSETPSKIHSPTLKKTIPAAMVEKMQSDLAEKSEAITILKHKVEHLENLLNVKDERIRDLNIQLQTIVNQTSRPESPSQAPRFFGFFQTASAPSEPLKPPVQSTNS